MDAMDGKRLEWLRENQDKTYWNLPQSLWDDDRIKLVAMQQAQGGGQFISIGPPKRAGNYGNNAGNYNGNQNSRNQG